MLKQNGEGKGMQSINFSNLEHLPKQGWHNNQANLLTRRRIKQAGKKLQSSDSVNERLFTA